jgi:hypothetical protein
MLIDLHVHTSRYSGCARSFPEEMVHAGIQAGLDGLVITEHGVIWGADEFAALQHQFAEIKLFRGVELSDGDANDFLIYGIDDLAAAGISTDMSPSIAYTIQRVHAAGGAVVLAHPFRYGPDVPPAAYSPGVDAVEVMSCNMLRYLDERVPPLPHELEVPAVSSSDGHVAEQVGCFATRFARPIEDDADLAAALRAGKYSLYADLAQAARADLLYAEAMPILRQLLDGQEEPAWIGD